MRGEARASQQLPLQVSASVPSQVFGLAEKVGEYLGGRTETVRNWRKIVLLYVQKLFT